MGSRETLSRLIWLTCHRLSSPMPALRNLALNLRSSAFGQSSSVQPRAENPNMSVTSNARSPGSLAVGGCAAGPVAEYLQVVLVGQVEVVEASATVQAGQRAAILDPAVLRRPAPAGVGLDFDHAGRAIASEHGDVTNPQAVGQVVKQRELSVRPGLLHTV